VVGRGGGRIAALPLSWSQVCPPCLAGTPDPGGSPGRAVPDTQDSRKPAAGPPTARRQPAPSPPPGMPCPRAAPGPSRPPRGLPYLLLFVIRPRPRHRPRRFSARQPLAHPDGPLIISIRSVTAGLPRRVRWSASPGIRPVDRPSYAPVRTIELASSRGRSSMEKVLKIRNLQMGGIILDRTGVSPL
jgi:hypothetical protein